MAKKEKDIFFLPGGGRTTDVKLYLKAWDELARPIKEFFGVQRVAFDPGILFEFPDGGYLDLDVVTIRKMNKVILEISKSILDVTKTVKEVRVIVDEIKGCRR